MSQIVLDDTLVILPELKQCMALPCYDLYCGAGVNILYRQSPRSLTFFFHLKALRICELGYLLNK